MLALSVEPSPSGVRRVIRFDELMGSGIDAMVFAVVRTLRHVSDMELYAPESLATMAFSLKKSFLPWLIEYGRDKWFEVRLNDLSDDLLSDYLDYLRALPTVTSSSAHWGYTKAILRAMASLGLIRSFAGRLPENSFPGVQSRGSVTPPYSKRERKALMQALASDYRDLIEGAFDGSEKLQMLGLVICLYLLAIQTGFNATVLMELRRDALEFHPIKRDHYLLRGQKRRGNHEVVATVAPPVVSGYAIPDVKSVFEVVLKRTLPLVELARRTHADFLFLCRPMISPHECSDAEVSRPINSLELRYCSQALAKRYEITSDEGRVLNLGTRRMRATLADRAMELSKGDIFIVSKLLGNDMRTAAIHYMTPDFDAPISFASAVAALAKKIKESQLVESTPTPVGSCTDSLYGRFAPRDGVTHCQRWLACFKCPNQCITKDHDDLWRVYSFYWMLHRRLNYLHGTAAFGLARFVIHVLDTVIPEQFGRDAMLAKDRARASPHPFWGHIERLRAIDLMMPDAGNTAN